MTEEQKEKTSKRKRADLVKAYRCKFLIAVIEDPHDIRNIGTIVRNVNALGVEKVYIVDPKKKLPDDWQEMRESLCSERTPLAVCCSLAGCNVYVSFLQELTLVPGVSAEALSNDCFVLHSRRSARSPYNFRR